MIRLGSGRARRALDHIQTAHVATLRIAPLGKVADVARASGETRIQKVCVQREDYIRLREVVARLDRLPEGQLRPFEHVVAIHRLIHMPFGLRISFQQRLHLVGQRGRRKWPGQDANPRSLQGFLDGERATNRAEKIIPALHVAQICQGLRPVGVVHPQNGSLRENIGSTQARGMLVVAFDLGGTEKMTLDQHGVGIAAQREGGRIK